MRMVAELMDDECLLTMEAMVSEFVENLDALNT